MRKPEKDLDRILATGSQADDADLEALARTADHLARDLALPAPDQTQTRAMFIEAVASRRRSMFSSLVAPGIAAACLVLVVALLGRGALPGETLYPVRKVLGSAGLASAPIEAVQAHVDDAELLVERADNALDEDQAATAEKHAVAALKKLGLAEGLLPELGADAREDLGDDIADLQEEALEVIREASDLDAIQPDDDGSSGEGSGDTDDNSGPGSGDDTDDNSGSGSDDDSSGSGSGDSDGDDNSGSGSGNSGSGSDNSGSG